MFQFTNQLSMKKKFQNQTICGPWKKTEQKCTFHCTFDLLQLTALNKKASSWPSIAFAEEGIPNGITMDKCEIAK